MKDTLISLEKGVGKQYLRAPYILPNDGIIGFMPAWLNENCFGAKVITVYHTNRGTGFPSHQGSVLLFHSKYGNLVAMVDATAITQVRTGAVSAFATDVLARPDAHTLALLGSGMQAESHLLAISHVRPLTQVYVWDIDEDRSRDFAKRMTAQTGLVVNPCPSAQEAVENTDIVCTLTPSPTPIIENSWVKPGTHINAVGASMAKDREIPSDLMLRAKIYGDSIESVLNESGDFLIPIQEGLYTKDHLVGTIGAAALGTIEKRTTASEITLFEALGLAIEDIAAAWYVYNACD